jgi:hypothetical protein
MAKEFGRIFPNSRFQSLFGLRNSVAVTQVTKNIRQVTKHIRQGFLFLKLLKAHQISGTK